MEKGRSRRKRNCWRKRSRRRNGKRKKSRYINDKEKVIIYKEKNKGRGKGGG